MGIPKGGLARARRAPDLRHMALQDAALAGTVQRGSERGIEGGETGRDEAAAARFQVQQSLGGRDGGKTILADGSVWRLDEGATARAIAGNTTDVRVDGRSKAGASSAWVARRSIIAPLLGSAIMTRGRPCFCVWRRQRRRQCDADADADANESAWSVQVGTIRSRRCRCLRLHARRGRSETARSCLKRHLPRLQCCVALRYLIGLERAEPTGLGFALPGVVSSINC